MLKYARFPRFQIYKTKTLFLRIRGGKWSNFDGTFRVGVVETFRYYDAVPHIVQDVMDQVAVITGRHSAGNWHFQI